MHLYCKNCPKPWKVQCFNPNIGRMSTLFVEAMCDTDLYCWYIFCVIASANNGLVVSEYTLLFASILNRSLRTKLPELFVVNGTVYTGTFSTLQTESIRDGQFFLARTMPQKIRERRRLKNVHEYHRKYIELLCGVLQRRFAIMRYEVQVWSDEESITIVELCAILNNMPIRLILGGEFDE